MKRSKRSNSRFFLSTALLLMVLAAATMLAPASASATQTSANATIINVVDVSWGTGTGTFHKQAFSAVKVATLAVAPNLTAIPSGTPNRTVAPGTFVTYSTAVASASNGPDTYNITNGVVTNTNIAAAPDISYPETSVILFGGYIPAASGVNGTIRLPGGSVTLNQLQNKYLVISGKIYQVTGNTAGTAPTGAQLSGTSVPEPSTAEAYAVVTLAAVPGGRWGYPAGDNAAALAALGAGTQVGEVTAVGTVTFTAASPTDPASDGTYANPFTFTSTATNLAGAAQSNSITFDTTVHSANVSITKWYRTLTNGVAAIDFTATDVDPSNPAAAGFFTGAVDPATAGKRPPKPGEQIQYLIIIRNLDGASAATNSTIYDPMPSYTTYVGSSTYRVTNVASGARTLTSIADSGGASVVAVTGSPNGWNSGSLSPNNYTMVSYKVTVN